MPLLPPHARHPGSPLTRLCMPGSTAGFQIISAVFCLHASGFAMGYGISKAMGLSEQICRTNSIEVREAALAAAWVGAVAP